MVAVFKREIKSYFSTPVGYVVLTTFALFIGLFYTYIFMNGSPDMASNIFSPMSSVSLFIIPIITMRLMSEDARQKTDQLLLTSPVKISSIVFGKFFAAFVMFAIGFIETFILQFIISMYVKVSWLTYFGNLTGILLFGAAMIAMGMFFSALTQSQVIAAVVTFAVSFVIVMLDIIALVVNSDIVNTVVNWISFTGRYNSFVLGVFDYSNAVFFISFATVFIFFTWCVIDKKRWA